eukprot:3787035-Amphidinium_carterae.2
MVPICSGLFSHLLIIRSVAPFLSFHASRAEAAAKSRIDDLENLCVAKDTQLMRQDTSYLSSR